MNIEPPEHLKKVLRDSRASVAWGFAANPEQAIQMSKTFNVDEKDYYTFEKVESHFGKEAAFAWATAVQARETFFAEVEKNT